MNMYPHICQANWKLKGCKQYNYSYFAAKFKIKEQVKDIFVSGQDQAMRQPISHLLILFIDRSIKPSISQLASQLVSRF